MSEPIFTNCRIGDSRAMIPNEAALDRILLALQRDSIRREQHIRRLCNAGFTVDQAAALHDVIVDITALPDDEDTL